MAKVMAASWNAGIFPVATVSTASSDHIRIAVNPINVAVREAIQNSRHADLVPGIHVLLRGCVLRKTWMAGTSPAMTTY